MKITNLNDKTEEGTTNKKYNVLCSMVLTCDFLTVSKCVQANLSEKLERNTQYFPCLPHSANFVVINLSMDTTLLSLLLPCLKFKNCVKLFNNCTTGHSSLKEKKIQVNKKNLQSKKYVQESLECSLRSY